MKCLVTGAGGFIGACLVEHLLGKRQVVHALDVREPAVPARKGGDFHFHKTDLLDRAALTELVQRIQPDHVFHLAAQSYPRVSWEKPSLTFEINVIGSTNLLEAVREAGLKPRILLVCSSAEYAPVSTTTPIHENAPLSPSSPYGISKMAEDHIGRLYFEYYGLSTVRARPFYLIGPGKTGDVSSDFARGIVAIERGQQKELAVGNLEVVRDLLDVRDGVDAFWILAQDGKPGAVYNVCSGEGYSVREVLDILKELARAEVREKVDPSRLRAIDEPVKIGDATSIKALGWVPRHSIRDSLKDILEYWRSR